MGYLFKGVCYPTQAQARQAECDGSNTVQVSGTTIYTAQCSSTTWTGTTYSTCLRTNGGTCTTRTVPFSADQECAWDAYTVNTDLAALFGLAVVAAVAVLAARWLYNYFRPDRNHEP